MLQDYALRAEQRGIAAEATALRSESVAMREIFAFGASEGSLTYSEVEQLIAANRTEGLDPEWTVKLARVVGLQNLHQDDRRFALAALSSMNPKLPKTAAYRRFHKLQLELLLSESRFEDAEQIASSSEDLKKLYYGYLPCDVSNPFLRSEGDNFTTWIRRFNAPLRAKSLHEVDVRPGDGPAFDRLRPKAEPPPVEGGPLVSVVLTTYQPQHNELMNSVRSIIGQTWRNLELIIVDDGSSDQYAPALDAALNLDARITLHRAGTNSGTYSARNIGFALAKGRYVTGQDTDDWSHPQRIERQVAALESDPQATAVQTFAQTMDADLVRTRIGYNPFIQCAVTFMLRTELARELGGYVEARKAADNEFRHRVERFTGRPTVMLKEPLIFVRVRPTSLSRADFKAGWQHPARRAFSSSYTHWHQTSVPADLKLPAEKSAPVVTPHRFAGEKNFSQRFDIVYAGDWTQLGGPQFSMLNEIQALQGKGLHIGVMHLDAARFMSTAAKKLCSPVQELINSGEVTHLLADDSAEVDLLILRYPPILQFPSSTPLKAHIRRLVIIANQAPAERDGTDIRYVPSECADNAEMLFGLRGLWAPQGPTVRQALIGHLQPDEITPYDVLGILDSDQWRTNRSYFRSKVPVLGRHSRDNVMKWPENSSALSAIYPTDASVDVRIMGGATTARNVLEKDHYPPNWVVFETNEMNVRSFLNSIDFFVYFQHSSAYDAFGRSVLEALAAGCVTILPHHFEETFGEAALYAEPAEVASLIRDHYENPLKFREQAEKAMAVVEHSFSFLQYVRIIEELLAKEPSTSGDAWWK